MERIDCGPVSRLKADAFHGTSRGSRLSCCTPRHCSLAMQLPTAVRVFDKVMRFYCTLDRSEILILFGFYVTPGLRDDEVAEAPPQRAKSRRICVFPNIGDLQSIRYRLSCVVRVEIIPVNASRFGHLIPDVLRRSGPNLSDSEPASQFHDWTGHVDKHIATRHARQSAPPQLGFLNALKYQVCVTGFQRKNQRPRRLTHEYSGYPSLNSRRNVPD